MPTDREEAEYWKGQVIQRVRGELEAVQKAAAAWSALFTAAIGVFGTVTFAGGLTGLEDLNPTLRPWVKGATVLAALATLVAVVYASMASGSMPKHTDDTTWDTHRGNSEAAAQTALGHLKVAKRAGVMAAVLVLGGSAAVLLAGPDDTPAGGPSVVAVINGQAVCGKLTKGAPLSVGTTPLVNVTSLTVLTSCPP